MHAILKRLAGVIDYHQFDYSMLHDRPTIERRLDVRVAGVGFLINSHPSIGGFCVSAGSRHLLEVAYSQHTDTCDPTTGRVWLRAHAGVSIELFSRSKTRRILLKAGSTRGEGFTVTLARAGRRTVYLVGQRAAVQPMFGGYL